MPRMARAAVRSRINSRRVKTSLMPLSMRLLTSAPGEALQKGDFRIPQFANILMKKCWGGKTGRWENGSVGKRVILRACRSENSAYVESTTYGWSLAADGL